MDKYDFIEKVWALIHFCYEAEWFEGLCKGNKEIECLGGGSKLAFFKFEGEERYFSAATLGSKALKGNGDHRFGELADATETLVSEFSGVDTFHCDRQQTAVCTVNKDGKREHWLFTQVCNIQPAN